jgi:hypothetical protein
MANEKIEIDPEAIRMSVRLNCLCGHGPEIGWMKVVSGTSASGEPANAGLGLRFECPACHRQVGVEVIVQPANPE